MINQAIPKKQKF